MKLQKKIITVLILITAFAFTACGGGSSSTGGGGTPGGGVTPAGTFTKQFGVVNDSNNSLPFSHLWDTKTQFLYTANEIGGRGKITKIRMQLGIAITAVVTCPDVTIKMGHTSLTELKDTAWTGASGNVEEGKGEEQIVFNNASIIFPTAAVDTWIDIPLDIPFEYNGVDNLVVDFARMTNCSASVFTKVSNLPKRRAESHKNDTHPGNTDYNTIKPDAVDNSLPWMQFVFEGGDNKVDFAVNYSSNIVPFSTDISVRKVQVLYNKSAIAGSGLITGIGFQVSALTAASQSYTYTMKLGHSTKTVLNSTWASNFDIYTPVIVANSVKFTVPAGVPGASPNGEFIWLPIPDGAFTYNGTDNLVVELTVYAADGEVNLAVHPTANANLLYGTPGFSAGTAIKFAYQIALRFYGGTMDVITGSGEYTANIFGNSPGVNSPNGMINLYLASELGTSCTITSIACRRGATVISGAGYANYKIIIGHSNLDQLVNSPAADNFVSQTTAMDGTVSVPAGREGDWIEIPLSTPFNYDGKSNLAVWLGTTADSGAAASHVCTYSGILARYANQIAVGIPGASTVGLANRKLDMKFNISR